jgi:hypothetical protein
MMPEHQSSAPPGENALPARAERKATNWIALLRTPDGTEIPCNVKDVSSSGARLGVPAHYELPPTFMLKVVGRDFVCRVRLAWRKGDYVGVQIAQIGKLATPSGTLKASHQTSPPSTTPYSAIGSRRSRISTF